MSILKNAVKSQYPGLYTKQKKDDLQYIARFKNNNKTFTKIIGLKSEGITLEEAYKIKLNIENEQKIKNMSEQSDKYLFPNLFQDFISFRSPYLAANTNRNYRSHYAKYFSIDFKDKDIRTLSQTDLQRYINKLLETKRPATVEKILYSIRAFYKYLISVGKISHNPTEYINLPKYDNKKYFSLPKKDVSRLIDYIMNMESQFYKTIYIFLLHGRRINEVLTLQYSDIDFNNKTYTINYKLSKNRKNQTFPLEDFQLYEIRELQKAFPNTKYLFENPTTKQNITYTSIFRVHKRLRNNLDLPNLTLHSFRHLVGFLLINKGHSLEVIAKILGQQNIQSTQRYSYMKMDKSKAAYEDIYSDFISF